MGMTRRAFVKASGVALAGMGVAAAFPRSVWAAAGEYQPRRDLTGELTAWDWSAAPDNYGMAQQQAFYTWFPEQHRKLKFRMTMFGYTDMLPKLEVNLRGGGGPDVVRVAIAWSSQFVEADAFQPIDLTQIGLKESDFWPGALMTVRKPGSAGGSLYGLPANNEAMMLIWNKGLFRDAGLNPDKAPPTWDDLAVYSKRIHDKTGQFGFGMVAKLNTGNTPFRFAPVMWAYGGSIFDELNSSITWKNIGIDSPGTVAALELYNRMFNIDKSVEPSALTSAQPDVTTLFLGGKVGMMIEHPSAAAQVHSLNPKIELGAGLLPTGPVRRAVVFGGSNLHVRRGTPNLEQALEFLRAYESPNWNARLSGLGSNPANRQAEHAPAQKEREKLLLFNDITIEMMKYGVSVPLVSQGARIWNETIPTMIQKVLLKQMSAKQAATEAAAEIRQAMRA
jgi:multiple sugar transport system substrate-binding protein